MTKSDSQDIENCKISTMRKFGKKNNDKANEMHENKQRNGRKIKKSFFLKKNKK